VSQHVKIDNRVVRLEKQCMMVGEVVQLQDSILGMAHLFFSDAVATDGAVLDTNVATIRFSKMQRSILSAKSTEKSREVHLIDTDF